MRNIGLLGVLLLAASCGGDEVENVRQKCELLHTTSCSRAIECGNREFSSVEQCRQAFEAKISCSAYFAVSRTFDQCIAETRAAACSAVLAASVPESCRGVLIREQ